MGKYICMRDPKNGLEPQVCKEQTGHRDLRQIKNQTNVLSKQGIKFSYTNADQFVNKGDD